MDRRVAVWMGPEQVGLVADVAKAAELSIVAAGCWGRGLSSSVAAELKAEPIRDLRAALASIEVDLFWIASPDSFGSGNAVEDANAIADAHARGVRIATSEPIPAAALDLSGGGWLEGAVKSVDVLRFVPRLGQSSGFRAAADVLDSFGAIRSMGIECFGSSVECSLGAHVFASLELVMSLMGEPETIDAACAVLSAGKAVRAMPGESLRDLHGDIAASLRFVDGRAAGIFASDQGGRWSRGVTLLGPGGRLRVYDEGFEWHGPDGKIVDEAKPKRARKASAPGSAATGVLAEGLARMLEPGLPEQRPFDHAAILTMAQTALLSARTGQGESPTTIRNMLGRV